MCDVFIWKVFASTTAYHFSIYHTTTLAQWDWNRNRNGNRCRYRYINANRAGRDVQTGWQAGRQAGRERKKGRNGKKEKERLQTIIMVINCAYIKYMRIIWWTARNCINRAETFRLSWNWNETKQIVLKWTYKLLLKLK